MRATFIFVVASLFACEQAIEVNRDPCTFPPVTSNFPSADGGLWSSLTDCSSCYININLAGDIYRFRNDQIVASRNFFSQEFSNIALFKVAFRHPRTAAELLNANQSFSDFVSNPGELQNEALPLGTMYLHVKDYCNHIYPAQIEQPVPQREFPERAYHTITNVEIIKLHYFTSYSGDFQVEGNFSTSILKDGRHLSVNGNYRVVLTAIPFF
jgi:hypothetical protein